MLKSTLVLTTAAVIALTSFDLRPATAAPEGGPAVVKQGTSDEFSSQRRKRRRGVHPAVPLAAFGAIVGTIATIAEANRRRDYYYDEGPYYVAPAPAYPHVYAPAPVYRHHGQGGYRGPRTYHPGPDINAPQSFTPGN